MEFQKLVDESMGNHDKSSEKMVSGGNFLKIEPLELRFTFEPKKQTFCCLYLSNLTKNYVAFKVINTNVTNYAVRPNTGIILPQTTCGITVTKKAENEPPTGMQCKDKFKIQSVLASPDITYITKNVFNEEEGYVIEECNLPVVYLSAALPLSPESEEAKNLLTDIENLNASQMSTMKLFNVREEEVIFPFEVNKQISKSLQLSNMTQNYVAFKVMTTHPNNYCVRPNRAVMAPQSASDITVTMRAQKAPPNAQSKDKFLIRGAVVSPSTTENDINWEMFGKECLVKDIKLRAVHTFTSQTASPFAEGADSEAVSSKTVSQMHNDSFDYSQMSTMELFNVKPEEVIFPFEVNKQISSSLQLSNMTKNYVAFKVMTTHPNIYCVRPNKAVIAPQSTSDITVTMQAQKAPPDAQRKDKFLIRSAVVSPSTTENNINCKTFGKQGLVKGIKLRAIHTFPSQAASPVAEGSDPEAGSSKTASQMQNDSFDYFQDITSHDNERNLPMFPSVFGMVARFFGLTSRSYDGYKRLK